MRERDRQIGEGRLKVKRRSVFIFQKAAFLQTIAENGKRQKEDFLNGLTSILLPKETKRVNRKFIAPLLPKQHYNWRRSRANKTSKVT